MIKPLPAMLTVLVVAFAYYVWSKRDPSPLPEDGKNRVGASKTKGVTREVVSLLRALGHAVVVEGPDHLKITGGDEDGRQIFVHNLKSELEGMDNENERAAIIERFVRLSMAPSFEEGAQRDLVVLIRHKDWVEMGKRALDPDQIRHVAADIYAVFAWDLGNRIEGGSIPARELGENPMARALKNIRKHALERIAVHQGDVRLVEYGGVYESSLLLDDAFWADVAKDVEGDIVAAVPARDLLLFTGSENAAGLSKMETAIRSMFEEGAAYPISRAMLRRVDGAWSLERMVKK